MNNILLKFAQKRCDKCQSYYEFEDYEELTYGCILSKNFECEGLCKYAFMPRVMVSIALKIRDWKIDRIMARDEKNYDGEFPWDDREDQL